MRGPMTNWSHTEASEGRVKRQGYTLNHLSYLSRVTEQCRVEEAGGWRVHRQHILTGDINTPRNTAHHPRETPRLG